MNSSQNKQTLRYLGKSLYCLKVYIYNIHTIYMFSQDINIIRNVNKHHRKFSHNRRKMHSVLVATRELTKATSKDTGNMNLELAYHNRKFIKKFSNKIRRLEIKRAPSFNVSRPPQQELKKELNL